MGFNLTSAPLFQAAGLHFRHTDNINHWRDAMSHVGLPSVTSPLCFPHSRDTLAFALCQYWGGCWYGRGGFVFVPHSLTPASLGTVSMLLPPEVSLVLLADLPPRDH